MEHINPDILTKNRYSVCADASSILWLDSGSQNTKLQNDIPNVNTATNLNPSAKKNLKLSVGPLMSLSVRHVVVVVVVFVCDMGHRSDTVIVRKAFRLRASTRLIDGADSGDPYSRRNLVVTVVRV